MDCRLIIHKVATSATVPSEKVLWCNDVVQLRKRLKLPWMDASIFTDGLTGDDHWILSASSVVWCRVCSVYDWRKQLSWGLHPQTLTTLALLYNKAAQRCRLSVIASINRGLMQFASWYIYIYYVIGESNAVCFGSRGGTWEHLAIDAYHYLHSRWTSRTEHIQVSSFVCMLALLSSNSYPTGACVAFLCTEILPHRAHDCTIDSTLNYVCFGPVGSIWTLGWSPSLAPSTPSTTPPQPPPLLTRQI